MGNSNSGYVNLCCENCRSEYGYISYDNEWKYSGDLWRNKGGYCRECANRGSFYNDTGSGGSGPWGGVGEVYIMCNSCDRTYYAVGWNTWKARTINKYKGYCKDCIKPKMSLSDCPTVPAAIRNTYVTIGHSQINNHKTEPYEDLKKDDDTIIINLNRTYYTDTKIDQINVSAPDSVTLRLKNDKSWRDPDYTLRFGTRGSTVHLALAMVTFGSKEPYSTAIHFGLLFTGNPITVTNNKTGKVKIQSYMMIHLLPDTIQIVLTKSKPTAMVQLHTIWRMAARGGARRNYVRELGHSMLSIKPIASFLDKEMKHHIKPYEYPKIKKAHKTLSKDWPSYKLATVTNCGLFVVRFSKLLNQAHTRKIEAPTASTIFLWTIGPVAWKNYDVFQNFWDHAKKYAIPEY